MSAYKIKCPKCGLEHLFKISDEDLEYARTYSIVRIGFIHKDHILIVDIDSSGTIRGAYLKSFKSILPGIKFIHNDYKIITSPIVESETQLIIVNLSEKKIDMRAATKLVSKIPMMIRDIIYISERAGKYKWYRGERHMGDEYFDIASKNDTVVLLKTKISDWKQKTEILKKIIDIVKSKGILDIDNLKEIVNLIEQKKNSKTT
ncbi:MAG: hypothetical protein Q6363_008260 [Candidatus Njordarchaeota archaeon]